MKIFRLSQFRDLVLLLLRFLLQASILMSLHLLEFFPGNGLSMKERLMASANETRTHILCSSAQFLKEFSSLFGESRRGVMAQGMTKIHEELWWGTLVDAKERFLNQQPKEELTLLIEGRTTCLAETPSEVQLEHELR